MEARVTYRNDTMVLSVDLQIGDTPYHVSTIVDVRESLPEAVALRSGGIPTPKDGECILRSGGAKSPGKNKLRVRAETIALVTESGLLCLVLLLILARKLKMVTRARKRLGHGTRRYQYRELAKATNKFDEQRKLGVGGSSEVYLGDECGRRFAVKKLISAVRMTDAEAQRRRVEFEAEVDIISRHKNLVRLLGWCDSSNGLLLVYELISGGSLDKHLYSTETSLSWNYRFRIIIGLGKALVYLHGEHSGTKYVVHGDIKPSNIMVDEELNAKLGDFGLARLLDHRAAAQTTETVMGTKGYIEPEFVETGKRSVESYLYSFGIVLLEMVTGVGPSRKALPSWVWELYAASQNTRVLEAASPALRSESNDRQMEHVLVVGLWCTQPARSERPSIAHAMWVLEHADAPLPVLPPSHGHLTLQGGLGGESPEHRRATAPLLGELSRVQSQMYYNTAPAATAAGEQGYGDAMTAVTASSRVHTSSAGNSTSYTTCPTTGALVSTSLGSC
ncbi:hypothetical protein C2845_PM03G32200 [Panicum miliaceum]|uniref:Protein kinase domain-containing protein n=1 Tax=Panicum miliaceum TaxID=4540 RepID=A0A3L6T5U5_PANMI|nr:hypothetical protein C2845_PM03G32200 [Panicum miliaceum]